MTVRRRTLIRGAAAGTGALPGHRVGVITNPTGVLQRTLGSVVDAMTAAGLAAWRAELAAFDRRRRPYLLYPRDRSRPGER